MSAVTLLCALLCPMLFAVGFFAGALLQQMEVQDKNRPELMRDNPLSRARVGHHVLLFGVDGEIVEAEWYPARRSAKEFGGKARDYSAGWIDHEGEEVTFRPIGIMPVPRRPWERKA